MGLRRAGEQATVPSETSSTYKWWALGAVGMATFAAVLDFSIINVSLPTITKALETDLATIQWVSVAHLLTITGLLLSFGRLGDMVGRKRVCVIGSLVFATATGLCGISQTVGQLIFFRVVQGVGSAMVTSTTPAITVSVFPSEERGKALGINSTIVAVGAVSGPVLGGLLVDAFDWRYIFFLRVPLNLLATALMLLVLRPDKPARQQHFDLPGAITLCIALSTLLLGLNQGGALGWGSAPIIGLFVVSAITLVAFVLIEWRSTQPVLALGLFRNRLFAASGASALLSFMASAASIFLMPFYLVQGLGYPPGEAGLLLFPQALTMSVVGPVSGWLSDRIGSRLLSSTGLTIVCAALLSFRLVDEYSSYGDIVVRLIALGIGAGLFQSPNSSALISAVPRNRLGTAAGMMSTMRTLGTALGTAIAGTVLVNRQAIYEVVLAGEGLAEQTIEIQSFIGGFRDALLVAGLICSVGVFTSLIRGSHHPGQRRSPNTLEHGPADNFASPQQAGVDTS